MHASSFILCLASYKKDYRSSTVRGFSLIPLTAHVTASDARPQFRKIMLKLKNIFFATHTHDDGREKFKEKD